MSAAAPLPEIRLPSRGRVGMACLILTESSFFAIFLVAYLFYVGKSRTGPYPRDVLDFPWLATACLLASSATVGLAVRRLRAGVQAGFLAALGATVALGAGFLALTGAEWARLIGDHGLTLRTNLFGTTFYSLVGFHAFHVLIGVSLLGLSLGLGLRGHVRAEHAERLEVLSWYWHFVDVVWLFVLTTVYVIGV